MERSQITKTKIGLLNQGVNFTPPNLFSDLENIKNCKTKKLATLPTIVDGRVFDLSPEENLIPSEILLSENNQESLTKLRYNPNSKLSIGLRNKDLKIFASGQALKLTANLVPKEAILSRETPVKIDNQPTKIGDFIEIIGLDRVSILLFDGCNNWNCGKACQFCDLHPKKKTDRAIRPTTNTLQDFDYDTEKWWGIDKENYFMGLKYSMQQIDNDPRFNNGHLYFMAGNLPKSADTWRVAKNLIGELSETVDVSKYKTILNIAPHDNIESLETIKSQGVKQVQYNLEVIGRDLFAQTCPGKLDYDTFVAKLKEAVGVFGFGNVRSNFVFGLQDKNELLKGIEELARRGIVADYSVFQPKKNTPLYNVVSPNQEEVLDFTDKLVDIYLQYGFKPIFSTVSSRSSVINEVYSDRIRDNLSK